ncbi:MAG: hypothetical protein H0U23_10340 [Blastocatellia bacterium]|nr:hypothetical protein [Blastocatellia bacterium]
MRIRPKAGVQDVRLAADADIQAKLQGNGRDYELTVAATPTAAGRLAKSVRLELIGNEGRMIAGRNLAVSADVVEPVVAVPARVHFGLAWIPTATFTPNKVGADSRGNPWFCS